MFDPSSNYWIYSTRLDEQDIITKHRTAISYGERLYRISLLKGKIAGLWERLNGRNQALHDLDSVLRSVRLISRHDGRVQTVPLSAIVGSEGRAHDFDSSFRPRSSHTRDRWKKIAAMRFADEPLPAVELIQIRDRYFVRDGHHRVSVAKALGQEMIDAQVTIIDVAGVLPWEQMVAEQSMEKAIPSA